MSVACPPHRVKQAGYGDGHGLLTQRQLHSGPDIHLSEVLLIACGQKDAVGVRRHSAGYQRGLHIRAVCVRQSIAHTGPSTCGGPEFCVQRLAGDQHIRHPVYR